MFEKLSSRDRSVMDAVIRSANDSLERGRTIAMSHIAKCESHIDELEQRVSNLTKERVEALKSMHQAVSDRGELGGVQHQALLIDDRSTRQFGF